MEKRIQHFIKFAEKELKLSSLPKINLVGHSEDNKRAFGHYKDHGSITVRMVGRHPLDVMRTIAHELTHYKQRSKNSKEQSKEDQANAIAGRIMRKYDEQNPRMFAEDATAASALPSNNIGSGEVATFSPLLSGGKKKNDKLTMLDRLSPSAALAKQKAKPLRSMVSKEKSDHEKKEKKFANPFGV